MKIEIHNSKITICIFILLFAAGCRKNSESEKNGFRFIREVKYDWLHFKWINDGQFKEYHPNGKIAWAGEFKNGLKNGTEKGWDEKGNLVMERSYLNGKRHGQEIKYFESGKKGIRQTYVNGVLHGKIEMWHENGVPQSVIVMNMGKPCGTSSLLDSVGNVIETNSGPPCPDSLSLLLQ